MKLRVARPVSQIERSARMYCAGLGFVELARFSDHQGFDGVILGFPKGAYHLEFTHCRDRPVDPGPTQEDLLVFYLPDSSIWQSTCESMFAAGFHEIESFNPYWQVLGKTFEDHDGYRVILQRDVWTK